MKHPFFKNHGPFKINDILKSLDVKNVENFENNLIIDVKDLQTANKEHLTFFHSKKYHIHASKTKASYCITLENIAHYLPKNCIPICVDNVLSIISQITSKFYPDAINDEFDSSVKKIEELTFDNNIRFGRNVLIGENVKIGKNSLIGHNTIVEKNVVIGSNCSIGSNVIIRNTIIENNVSILDGCIIGKKGFGFFPNSKRNLRYPHIGVVIIGENSEIGCGATIDRCSMSNTIIGKNTFLDNQIHIAHNNKIGDNCIIAGQVGFAGSSTLGNNVQIGGGSGVIKDIPDNSKVMGYPSKDLRQFLKNNK